MRRKSATVVAAITNDLRDSNMSLMLIAIKHKVGLSFVNQVAKASGQSRKRGPKPVQE
jgi:hypothetical protein